MLENAHTSVSTETLYYMIQLFKLQFIIFQVTVIGVLEKLYSILTHCKPECLEEITNQNLNKLFNAISSSFEVCTAF